MSHHPPYLLLHRQLQDSQSRRFCRDQTLFKKLSGTSSLSKSRKRIEIFPAVPLPFMGHLLLGHTIFFFFFLLLLASYMKMSLQRDTLVT